MARFFNFFNPYKAGAGVGKNQPQKKRIFLGLETIGRSFFKLVKLNLLYLLFCLPIITIGPATAAFVYILKNISNRQPIFIFHDFLSAFKKNFKGAFIISIIDLVVISGLSYSVYFYSSNISVSKILFIPYIISLIFSLIFLFMNYYMYLMLVTVQLPLSKLIKNSFLLSFIGFKSNLITTIFLLIIYYISFIIFPISIFLILLFFLSLAGFIISFNSLQYIEKYIIQPESKPENVSSDQTQDAIFSDEKL